MPEKNLIKTPKEKPLMPFPGRFAEVSRKPKPSKGLYCDPTTVEHTSGGGEDAHSDEN